MSGIIPTFEVHVNTPVPRFRDSVDLTFGTKFEFYKRASLGIGVATPVTGPRLFEVEALANFNFRF